MHLKALKVNLTREISMKKFIFVTFSLISFSIFAANSGKITQTTTFFPGAGINSYSQGEVFLLNEAEKFCAKNSLAIEKISNINIQLKASFSTEDILRESELTVAIDYPKVTFSADVLCK